MVTVVLSYDNIAAFDNVLYIYMYTNLSMYVLSVHDRKR